MRRNALLMALLLSAAPLFSQLPDPDPKPITGARMPALSPDGKRLAFVYRGDIWLADSSGGRARPLTFHLEFDAYPVFSPDGRWLAFGSKRTGNWDIFVMPSDGGSARQLTWHSSHELPFGWSPDGSRIAFGARRNTPTYSILSVDVSTYRTRLICEDYANMRYPRWSPDGNTVLYTRYGMPWYRPRYRGAAASTVWVFDTIKKQRRKVLGDDRQFLFSQFLPGGKEILTVTTGEATPTLAKLDDQPAKFEDNPKRTPNLWVSDLEGNLKQLTQFETDSVRYPSVASQSGDIAFEYGDSIWTLAKDGKPRKLTLFVNVDEKNNSKQTEKSTSGVTEAEPSPDGKTMLFGLHGDIWTVKTLKSKGINRIADETAIQHTTWAGDDSDFSWSKDCKKFYFTSDREGNTRIYEYDLEKKSQKPLWNRKENIVALRASPDGKALYFWVAGPEGGLHRLDLKDGQHKQILKLPGTHLRGRGGLYYEWSPDMKWIAYTTRTGAGSYNIWVMPADGGKSVNITKLRAFHSQPKWSPDGKYIYFQSSRSGDGLYRVALKTPTTRTVDTDEKYIRPTKPVKVEIDFDGINNRIQKLSSTNPSSGLTITKEGNIFFLSGGDVYRMSYDGRESKKLNSGGGRVALRVLENGRTGTFMKSGAMHLVKLDTGQDQVIKFTATWTKDVFAQRTAALYQFWKTYDHQFYDANFHGRDWQALRDKYLNRLPSVDTHDEFAILLQMMVGELEASHTELSAKKTSVTSPSTPHIGFTIDYQHEGVGLRVLDVPLGAPGSYEKTRIAADDYVLAVDGTRVSASENLYESLNLKGGQIVEFTVNDKPELSGARKIKYKLLSSTEWSQLQYRNWIQRSRQYIEKASANKVGYLHLAAMGSSDQRKFENEVYEYILGKEAMIFDVRNNRGGNISDTLIDWLERKPHGIYKSRDREPEIAPERAWNKPVIVLMNEHSYSNGEMFPYAMRQRGLAKLIGMPTPGYVIWTSSFTLGDGTRARIPGRGVFRMDGTNMENNGEKPDVQVWITPDQWLNQEDPQIDKALELLLPKPALNQP